MNKTETKIIEEIESTIEKARKEIALVINKEMLNTYWMIGKIIVENEQEGNMKSFYGKSTLKNISDKLTLKYGRGYSLSNLKSMRKFYLLVPNRQTSDFLTRSHYLLLFDLDDAERNFYIEEVKEKHLSVRELKREIDTLSYQRSLIGALKNPLTIEKGINSELIIKDPYVLEFLDIKNINDLKEKDLEKQILLYIGRFLLEFGKGFSFVSSQNRISLGRNNYYVDLVFYNNVLKTYVLIDLKMHELKPEDVGQMNFYINYYKNEIIKEDENEPIGLILCASKNNISASYSLEGITNKIFASRVTNLLPSKESLEKEISYLINRKQNIEKLEINRKILNVIKSNNNVNIKNLCEELKVSKRTIYRSLKEMKEYNLIRRIGNNKTGYYEVIDSDTTAVPK